MLEGNLAVNHVTKKGALGHPLGWKFGFDLMTFGRYRVGIWICWLSGHLVPVLGTPILWITRC